ncbi:MAG: winged helix-turn-helix domain-containing protein [Pseudomonadota bacterium]
MNRPKQRAKQIYEELRERICLLDYKPGEIIKERDLADEFGVSRTPLRRVLQMLENDGLIQSKQGHGTVVAEIDLQ